MTPRARNAPKLWPAVPLKVTEIVSSANPPCPWAFATFPESIAPVAEDIYSVEILPVNAHVKRGRFVSAHLHLNVTYLLQADDAQLLRPKPDENSSVAWLPLDQAADNREEPFMAVVYRKLNGKLSNY